MKSPDKFISVAESFIGKLQKGVSSPEMEKMVSTYNSQNPLPRGCKATINSAYCAIFVTACGILSGTSFTYELGAWECMRGEKDAGRFHKDPKIGDLVFFKYPSNYHVGLIEDIDNEYIYTIEGNVNNGQCCRMTKRRDDSTIQGYSTPVFEDIEEPEETNEMADCISKIIEQLEKIKNIVKENN